ncbi:MAG: 2-amino-4-hydroxy-6-hydroxymethyldihydropteridine diphosphokinase [Pyrinomonadaceae bacterium]
MSHTHIYVGLGSNLGDRAGHLLLGVRGMLAAGLCVSQLSSIYETEPVDVVEQPLFLNMVAELRGDTPYSPEQVLTRLLRIEYAIGRRRDTPKGPRTIDLDLLLYRDVQQTSELLTLPHPRMHLRRFVLTPLAELAPDLVHPTRKQSVQQLLADLRDEARICPWQPTEG